LRRLTAVLILTVALTAATACTPGQVTAFFNARGQTIDQADASFVAQALDRWADQQRMLLDYLAAVAASQRSCYGPPTCATLVRRAFTEAGIAHRAEEGVRVMMCESGGNPNARNGSSSASGLFQQLATYWPGRAATYGMAGRSVFDPWANAVVSAGMVRDTGGWSHWSCKP
jgi:hypothetical protein